MAIGFTPKHIEEYPLKDISEQQFLVIGLEALKKLGWQTSYISESGFIANTNNSIFTRNSEIKVKIENGIATLCSASEGNEVIDFGKNKKNIQKLISVFEEAKLSLTAEAMAEKYDKAKVDFPTPDEDILKLPPPSTGDQINDFVSIFNPIEGYFFTPILINLNILLFIIMVATGVHFLEPDSESLLQWGANFRPSTMDGEWWRLLTACFIHIGIIHLLMNMYALLYIGILLEPYLGKTRFISAYLLTGITASLASLWWHDYTVSAGASGAIFGMYGVFLAMLTTNLIEKTTRNTLLTSIAVFVGYNLLYGLKGGIDNAAHIGGLIGGIVIGYAFIPGLKRPNDIALKFGTIALMTALIIGSVFFVSKKTPNDIAIYETKMKEFVSMESMALEVYSLPKTAKNSDILYALKERGIYYWYQNLYLLEDLEKLNLPDVLHERNKKLKEYCELRIKCYELIYKAILENTDMYEANINDYNRQIEAIINDLSGK
ncbi:MAG: rhomboid family intramembrane serine protease [Bacteroidia bacterium]